MTSTAPATVVCRCDKSTGVFMLDFQTQCLLDGLALPFSHTLHWRLRTEITEHTERLHQQHPSLPTLLLLLRLHGNEDGGEEDAWRLEISMVPLPAASEAVALTMDSGAPVAERAEQWASGDAGEISHRHRCTLDEDGCVVEGVGSSVFLIDHSGRLATSPHDTDHMRQCVLDACDALAVPVRRGGVAVGEVVAGFVANAVDTVAPIHAIRHSDGSTTALDPSQEHQELVARIRKGVLRRMELETKVYLRPWHQDLPLPPIRHVYSTTMLRAVTIPHSKVYVKHVCETDLARPQDYYQQSRSVLLLALRPGTHEPVACVALREPAESVGQHLRKTDNDKDALELLRVVVHEDCRGWGLGISMVQHAEWWARRRGARALALETVVQLGSMGFWESRGFRQYSDEHFDDGAHMLHFIKRLT